jgi:hypothetical protein
MKTRIFLLLLFITMIPLSGNTQPYVLGDKVLNFGLGIGSTLYTGAGYNTGIPPLSVSFEYGLKELGPGILGIGGYFGISSYQWESSIGGSTYGWKYSSTIIGARGNYHYNFIDKLDTYAGLMLGFNVISSKETGDWPFGVSFAANSSRFAYSFYVGGRYYFTESFAVMGELGYGISWLNLGVALKF